TARCHFRDAEDMLKQNLDLMITDPEPDREAHERSLFAYADLLFRRRKFVQATTPYEQALNLYPASGSTPTGRYRLGLCCRNLAAREAENLQPSDPLNFQRHYHAKFALWLEKAAANFQKLVDDLQARQDAGSLSEADVTLFRQARFALAQCRCELNHYEQAIPIYISLADQYDRQVDGLVARQKLYFCYILSMPPEKQQENL